MDSLIKLAEQVQTETRRTFDRLLTPEIMENLTEEQKKAVNIAQNPLNLQGGLSANIDNLQTMLSKLNGL